MKNLFYSLALGTALTVSGMPALAVETSEVVDHYADIVYANYQDSYQDAVKLQKTINLLLDKPTDNHLALAKQAWLKARESYGQTEAYRFYEGPIDYVDTETGIEGPEGRLNAWPLNEAYIDYVKGNENAGIVQDKTHGSITKDLLIGANQSTDEANVSTGYHAIEFLLWGQDLYVDSAGKRPVSDYTDTAENQRRRTYLKLVADILVNDLKFLAASWEPGKENYAATFRANDHAIANILTSLTTLSGFELASERMATALDSGDQEDEHSCFSDNTHNDFIMNAKGISNVYFGRYNDTSGASLHDLISEKDAELAEKIKTQLETTEELINNIPTPIDQAVLASPEDSAARKTMEKAVTSLQTQADLFKEAGKVLGVQVEMVTG